MKTYKYKLSALAMGVAMALGSLSAGATAVPAAPGAGLAAIGAAPFLFPSEQGAFKALEVTTQIIESDIVQNGCTSASYPFTVTTGSNGSGVAVLGDLNSGRVNLRVAFVSSDPVEGRLYRVTGNGALNGLAVANIVGNGSFNIGSTIQELSTTWSLTSPVTGTPDFFKGTIIKDYWRLNARQPIPGGFNRAGTLVSTTIDYGYQQVTKNNYVQAKYWQQSRTWRVNGVNAGTYWKKTLVTPIGEDCAIEVRIAGTDRTTGFSERGTVAVLGAVLGSFAK